MTDNIRYLEIFETLKSDILGGKYASSRSFPSSRSLAKRFKTTRATIRRALDLLRNQGFIGSRRGACTYLTKEARARKIGLIVPGIGYNEFYLPIVSEINRLAQAADYSLQFNEVYSADEIERVRLTREAVAQLIKQRVAGVIYQPVGEKPGSREQDRRILTALVKARIPVVLIDGDITSQPERSEYDVVGINDLDAGYRVAAHLLSVGARKIHFLQHRECIPNGGLPNTRRLQGVMCAMRNFDCRTNANMILQGPSAIAVKSSDADLDFPRRKVHDLELEILEVA